jgi:peptidoglycan/LPS O-acetylase OafA/YrhL
MGICLLILGFLFIKAKSLFIASDEMTSWGYSMFAGVYLCILALAFVPDTIPNRIGRVSVLRFFGKYSYGIYIWHQLPSPICIFGQAWFARKIHPPLLGQTVSAMVMLALSTALAVLSYHFLELPFLRLKSRFRYEEPKDEHSGMPYAKARFVQDAL